MSPEEEERKFLERLNETRGLKFIVSFESSIKDLTPTTFSFDEEEAKKPVVKAEIVGGKKKNKENPIW